MTNQEVIERGLKAKDLLEPLRELKESYKEKLWDAFVVDDVAYSDDCRSTGILFTCKGIVELEDLLQNRVIDGEYAQAEMQDE